MRDLIITLAVIAWVAVVVSCAVADPDPSRPVRPSGPNFDHKAHIENIGECEMCHGDESAGFNSMPTLETCNECHTDLDAEKPPEKRASSLFDEQGQGRFSHQAEVGDEIVFDHARHAKAHGNDCRKCHADVADSTAVPVSAGFSMAECMACHAQSATAAKYNECASCHKVIREDVAPESHKAGWKQRHGRVVRDRGVDVMPQDCKLCHEQTDCDTCHRTELPRNHTNTWRRHGHAAAASIDRESCRPCHTTDSCAECHERAAPRTHRGAWGPPFDRHCNSCHLPAGTSGSEGCAVCHKDISHATAPPRPGNPPHMTNNPQACRVCHNPPPHPDNGQSCLLCHR